MVFVRNLMIRAHKGAQGDGSVVLTQQNRPLVSDVILFRR